MAPAAWGAPTFMRPTAASVAKSATPSGRAVHQAAANLAAALGGGISPIKPLGTATNTYRRERPPRRERGSSGAPFLTTAPGATRNRRRTGDASVSRSLSRTKARLARPGTSAAMMGTVLRSLEDELAVLDR